MDNFLCQGIFLLLVYVKVSILKIYVNFNREFQHKLLLNNLRLRRRER